LQGGVGYYDAVTNDARLVLDTLRSAAAAGAAVINYARLLEAAPGEGGRWRCVVADVATGATTRVDAACVVNAAGPWADRFPQAGVRLRCTKGVHLVFDHERLPVTTALVMPHGERIVFAIPWGCRTYVGTTDTDYEGPIDDPQCTPEDIEYLLGAVNRAIDEPVATRDVLSTWAGFRPLLRGARNERTADLSRRHAVRVSESGVVTITGGKLTTYRSMAADTVDQVARILGRRRPRSKTKKLRLVGADGFEAPPDVTEPSVHDHLAGRYGTEAEAVHELLRADRSLGEALVPGLPYVRAEAIHAVRHEMARNLDDVLTRRTRARILARDASVDAAASVAVLIAPELGWSAEEAERQVDAYRASAARERESAGLPETALDASLGA
jgi:glycerol-3-phosphate dehydrogenase